jgi:DNA primase
MSLLDFNDAIIAQIRDATDIVDLIGAVTPLKGSGGRFTGLCPFHREKTPSFNVDRAKGFFHCFGCGAGGDAFKFLALNQRMTFPEALEYLASRSGIEVPRKNKQRDPGRDALIDLLDQTALAWQQALERKPNSAAEYLAQRGIPESTIERFGMGYAPDSWDFTLNRFARNFTPQQLEQAGLVLPRKQGNGHYDRFRNRLMIPIHGESGKVIGFGGRSLDGSDPKYMNSPESPLFAKSTLLYNLHRAKEQIRRTDRAILVEGYFDCIALETAGIGGVVASMGTSLTSGQAAVLRRHTRNVVIAYDGDEAGRNAALRAAPIFLAAGMSVGIVDVGSGDDPDTYVKKAGAAAFVELVEGARDVVEFAIERWVGEGRPGSAREKSELVERFVPLLTAASDPVVRNDAAQRVASALRLEFETIWDRVRGRRGAPRVSETVASAPMSSGEKLLLRAALQGELSEQMIARLEGELFTDPSCRNIFDVMQPLLFSGQSLDFSRLATHVRGEAEITILSELALTDESHTIDPQTVETTIRLLERSYVNRRLKQLQIEIQEAERLGDSERERYLFEEKQLLSRQLTVLK